MNAQQIRTSTALQKSLAAGLKKIGVEVKGALIDGNVEALASSIQAVAKAHRALRRPQPHENAPAIERLSKGITVEKVAPVAPTDRPSYQILDPLVELKRNIPTMTPGEINAAERFRDAHELMHRSEGVANWLATPGGGGAGRLELSERQQIAGAELKRAYETLGKDCIRAAALNFILQVPVAGQSTVLGWRDFVNSQIMITDEIPARWIAYGWLHQACQKLARVYDAMDAETKIERRYFRTAANSEPRNR